MSIESSVGLTQESIGPKVRTLKIQVVDDDGQVVSTVQQVVSISDEDGLIISADREWQQELLSEVRKIRSGLEFALERFLIDPKQ